MKNISQHASYQKTNELTFRLNTPWDEATEKEKQLCVEEAMEACRVICSIIVPKDHDMLLNAMLRPPVEDVSADLVALMTAHKLAPSKQLKTQILSIYANRYNIDQLIQMHEKFEKITEWQVKQARKHARTVGPGATVKKLPRHHISLDVAKLSHLLEFTDRPYFFQDVAFGARTLK